RKRSISAGRSLPRSGTQRICAIGVQALSWTGSRTGRRSPWTRSQNPNFDPAASLLTGTFRQSLNPFLVGGIRRSDLGGGGRVVRRHGLGGRVVAADHPHVIERMLHAIEAGT